MTSSFGTSTGSVKTKPHNWLDIGCIFGIKIGIGDDNNKFSLHWDAGGSRPNLFVPEIEAVEGKEKFAFNVVDGVESQDEGLVFEDGVDVDPVARHQVDVRYLLGGRGNILGKDVAHVHHQR